MSETNVLLGPDKIPRDVRIRIFDTTFHLHSSILSMSSDFFEASFSERWQTDGKSPPTKGKGVKYNLHLSFDESGDPFLLKGEGDTDTIDSKFHKLAVQMREELSENEFMKSVWYSVDDPQVCTNTQKRSCACSKEQAQNIINAFDSLFRIIYHKFQISDRDPRIIKSLLRIVELADSLSCMPSVSASVTQAVMGITDLGKAIGEDPMSFLRIAEKCRASVLYNDAFVHMVGRWKKDKDTFIEGISYATRDLVEKEYTRLMELQLTVVFDILPQLKPVTSSWDKFVGSHISGCAGNSGMHLFKELASRAAHWRNMHSSFVIKKKDVDALNELMQCNLKITDGRDAKTSSYLLCAKIGEDEYPWSNGEEW